MVFDSLPPGQYLIEMNLPTLLAGNSGAIYESPNSITPGIEFETKLFVGVLAQIPKPEKTPYPQIWLYVLSGVSLFALGVVGAAVFFKRRR